MILILDSFSKSLMASLLLMIVALLSATVTGAADSANIRATCWATAALSEDLVAVARDEQRWSCSSARQKLSIDAERVLLRFYITADRVLPQYLLSRRSALEAVHLLMSISGDGDLASLYERADRLLYEAKDNGRNKTESAVSATASPKAVKINKASRA
ncbi:MAG: hypothetical protein PGN20_15740 [Agrobacterium cavarae]